MTDTAIDSAVSVRTQSSNSDTPRFVVLILLALTITFNAIALFPEVEHTTPSRNDQVFHYLFIERANQAIAAGDNPVDHWLPELELGFAQFFYYQNLPHLLIVGLYRLLLGQVSLIRLLNLVRYVLLVTFPLTVYWSMRRMEFSQIASAVGAAVAPMLSSSLSYGFDFHTYVWGGYGMFPQLCAMHLMFIGTACLRRVLEHGQGFAAAIIASAAIVLSDLLYGYIFGIAVAILWLLSVLKNPSLTRRGLRETLARMKRSSLRLAIVVVPAVLITAYQIGPFFAQIQYLNQALPSTSKRNARALIAARETARSIVRTLSLHLGLSVSSKRLSTLVVGFFFDNDRLPVITCVVAIGIFYALRTRRKEAKLALTMLAIWLLLLIPNPIRFVFVFAMPFASLLPFFRLMSGVDFAAILLAGLGGECIWKWCRSRSPRIRVMVPTLLLIAFFTPVIVERWGFYQISAQGLEATDQALREDQDLPRIISWLKQAPPGRVYAGSRGNWGTWMSIGWIHLYDLLPIEQFATLMPWQTLSLNAPLLWQLNLPTPELCRLFNIRYIVAPPSLTLDKSYRTVLTTERYIVYEVDSGGYLQLGRVTGVMPIGSSRELFKFNDSWLNSQDPVANKFVAFLAPGKKSDAYLTALLDTSVSEGSPPSGSFSDEVVTPDSLSASVSASGPTVLVIKVTYHPNWHVTIDGREQRTFMVSPSYIGTRIEAGRHKVRAEYRSSTLKKILLALACLSLLTTIIIWTLGLEERIAHRLGHS